MKLQIIQTQLPEDNSHFHFVTCESFPFAFVRKVMDSYYYILGSTFFPLSYLLKDFSDFLLYKYRYQNIRMTKTLPNGKFMVHPDLQVGRLPAS